MITRHISWDAPNGRAAFAQALHAAIIRIGDETMGSAWQRDRPYTRPASNTWTPERFVYRVRQEAEHLAERHHISSDARDVAVEYAITALTLNGHPFRDLNRNLP